MAKQRPNIGDKFTTKPRSLWYKPQYQSSNGTNILKTIFGGQRVFDYPKAVTLITDLLKFGNVGPNDIVLDSFAGSGTTAHAVLDLNKEDGGNRKYTGRTLARWMLSVPESAQYTFVALSSNAMSVGVRSPVVTRSSMFEPSRSARWTVFVPESTQYM